LASAGRDMGGCGGFPYVDVEVSERCLSFVLFVHSTGYLRSKLLSILASSAMTRRPQVQVSSVFNLCIQ
jgi:hypothetical protein